MEGNIKGDNARVVLIVCLQSAKVALQWLNNDTAAIDSGYLSVEVVKPDSVVGSYLNEEETGLPEH